VPGPGRKASIARGRYYVLVAKSLGAKRPNSMLKSICDFMVTEDQVTSCDLIFVLAGRLERKNYGLKLFRQGMALRLVLSVGRYEVRHTAALLPEGSELIAIRDKTPPAERHFWVELAGGRRTISLARIQRIGTYEELNALASWLASQPPARIALISTSIHLRRVRYCCSRIPFFTERNVYLWPVPEQDSSFRRSRWWTRWTDARYLISELVKLAGYRLLYR